MLVQLNTDSHVDGGAAVEAAVVDRVTRALDRFGDQVTRVEIHVADENSGTKGGGADIRCSMEARIAGRPPLVVRHDGATLEQATDGAARKMRSALDTALGKAGRR